MTPPWKKKKNRSLYGGKTGKKNDRGGMITTSKHSDSRGRANERARTGIESERARAVFQNIHSHIGQWTFWLHPEWRRGEMGWEGGGEPFKMPGI